MPRKDSAPNDPELRQALARLEQARNRLLSAAIAFCDGSISAGQLRAVRELLKEQETRVRDLEGRATPALVEEALPPPVSTPDPSVARIRPAFEPRPIDEAELYDASPELQSMLESLDRKIAQLEQDFQQGRINASQYRAIRKHYVEQKQVALRLQQSHPDSDRWRVVLEEGKTTFLLQLNEASCRGVAFYDMKTRGRIFLQGEVPQAAEEAMALLQTFEAPGGEGGAGRMLATQADDGTVMVLIPGQFTAALVVFSQEPPGWQVRALREVHRNFEAANKMALSRAVRGTLIYPDLSRFIRE
jgi:hypothetical protein